VRLTPTMGNNSRPEAGCVVVGAQGVHTIQSSFRRIRPLARADSSGDQEPAERDRLTIRQAHQPACPVEAEGGHAKPPLGIDSAQARQLGVARGYPTL
jgi:hypothetical protein